MRRDTWAKSTQGASRQGDACQLNGVAAAGWGSPLGWQDSGVGIFVGATVGAVGAPVGWTVGRALGSRDGVPVGALEGVAEGAPVGRCARGVDGDWR